MRQGQQGIIMIRYDTVDLRALKSWRDGQLNLAHGPKIKKNWKQKPSSSEETARAIVREGSPLHEAEYEADVRHYEAEAIKWPQGHNGLDDFASLLIYNPGGRHPSSEGRQQERIASGATRPRTLMSRLERLHITNNSQRSSNRRSVVQNTIFKIVSCISKIVFYLVSLEYFLKLSRQK